MGLGNNRDYVTRDRDARRRLFVVKMRAAELAAQGIADPMATAYEELRSGALKAQLRAWVDPILAHRRLMRAQNTEGGRA